MYHAWRFQGKGGRGKGDEIEKSPKFIGIQWRNGYNEGIT
jgi:hypothetical protein